MSGMAIHRISAGQSRRIRNKSLRAVASRNRTDYSRSSLPVRRMNRLSRLGRVTVVSRTAAPVPVTVVRISGNRRDARHRERHLFGCDGHDLHALERPHGFAHTLRVERPREPDEVALAHRARSSSSVPPR